MTDYFKGDTIVLRARLFDPKGSQSKATLQTNLAGADNNDLIFTAKTGDTWGNNIAIEYVLEDEPDIPLSLVVNHQDIKVTLETGSGTKASLTTNLTGNNNDLIFEAIASGAIGNNVSIAYVDPGGVTATLACVVVGGAITLNLGRAASAITTTAGDIKNIIGATAGANALVHVNLKPDNNYSGIVTAMLKTNLSGGVDGTISSITTAGDIKGLIEANSNANALVSVEVPPGNNSSGAVGVMVKANLSGGTGKLLIDPDDNLWTLTVEDAWGNVIGTPITDGFNRIRTGVYEINYTLPLLYNTVKYKWSCTWEGYNVTSSQSLTLV